MVSSFKSAKFNEVILRDQFFLLHINFNNKNKTYSVLKIGIFRCSSGLGLSGGKPQDHLFPLLSSMH